MVDREFTTSNSLLTALSGRTRGAKKASVSKAQEASGASANAGPSSRRHRFDDKSGPPPPRGSLTNEKLSYLDWRLKRINHVRQKSEGTSSCWIDGRDTIGRNSIDVGPSRRVEVVQVHEELTMPRPAPQPVMRVSRSIAAVYADEKAAGLKALEQAYADSVLASLPHLAKRDSSSGSEMSGSSDQHAQELPAAAVLHATSDKDVGGQYFAKPKKSLFSRAGFGRKKNAQTAETNTRSIARIWNR